MLAQYMRDLAYELQPKPAQTITVQRRADSGPKFSRYDVAAAVTLQHSDMGRVHYIECTSAADITLPSAADGDWVDLVNCGASTLTLKDGATTLCTVKQDEYVHVVSVTGTSGAPEWPDGLIVFGKSGRIRTTYPIVVDGSGALFTVKDSANHYWTFTVNTSGALVSADNGLTEPL